MQHQIKIIGKLALVVVLGMLVGTAMLFRTSSSEEPVPAVDEKSLSLEEQAKMAWMKGCVPHTVEEAQKVTDVVNLEAATAKAQVYCQCDWDYMVNSMGLSLEDIACIGQEGSRGSSAITAAQNYCFDKHKGDYL